MQRTIKEKKVAEAATCMINLHVTFYPKSGIFVLK